MWIPQENICVGVFFNKAAGLKIYNSIKKRPQHRCFPVKFSKFLRTYFFTEEFQWLLLNFNSCFQRSSKQKPVGVSAINTRFTWKKVFAAAKTQKHPLQMSYKRKPARAKTGGEYYEIFKYLFWKVSVNSYFWKSAPQWQREVIPEFHYSFKPFSILNFLWRNGFVM